MKTAILANQITTRHIMALISGAVIPVLLASNNFQFLGIWIAGFVFCIYAFKRQGSEAATFGMFVTLIVAMLIAGSFDAHEISQHSELVYPANSLQ